MKKKTFREQIEAAIKKRDREVDARKLAEATTPAAETLITYIRQWNFASRNVALGRLLECYRWAKNGTMVLEKDHKGNAYPLKMPMLMAYERFMYGDLSVQFFPAYNFPEALKHIPSNVTKDWAEEIRQLLYDINRMPLNDFKLICLGKCVKSLGATNPHAIAQWEREVSQFKEAQEAINAFVVTRKGWEHMTTENLQNPTHKVAMSKVLSDILANADAVVKPSFAAIKEQDRQMYIRQDATGARNDIKGLQKFFQKYGAPEPAELSALGNLVNDIQSQALNPQTEPKKGATP